MRLHVLLSRTLCGLFKADNVKVAGDHAGPRPAGGVRDDVCEGSRKPCDWLAVFGLLDDSLIDTRDSPQWELRCACGNRFHVARAFDNLQALASLGVPHANRAVKRLANDPPSVRAVGYAIDLVFMSGENG